MLKHPRSPPGTGPPASVGFAERGPWTSGEGEMGKNPVETFIDTWEGEARGTVRLLESLPQDQYDFRPDPEGRSLGELAWHLAEIEAFIANGVAEGKFDLGAKPKVERPREVKAL